MAHAGRAEEGLREEAFFVSEGRSEDGSGGNPRYVSGVGCTAVNKMWLKQLTEQIRLVFLEAVAQRRHESLIDNRCGKTDVRG
jgi:hypothetical protein